MSRSRKKNPFWSVCGTDRDDKPMGRRGVRRRQNQFLKGVTGGQNQELENLLLPHRYECSHNQTYTWGRDGGQIWWGVKSSDIFYHGSIEAAREKLKVQLRK